MTGHSVGLASSTLVNYWTPSPLSVTLCTYRKNTFLGIDTLFNLTLTFMSSNDMSQNPGSTVTVGTAKNTHFMRIRTHCNGGGPYSAIH